MLPTAAKQQAFSMIEVLIALVIIGVGYVALSLLHVDIAREAGLTYRQAESADNAWQAMDSIRNISSYADYTNYTTGAPKNIEDSTQQGEFTITRRIVSVHTNPDYIIVEGISTWTDANGILHTERFRTAMPAISPENQVYTWN